MDKASTQNQPSQTVAKALLVLESFSASNSEWGIRELSRELDINPSTLHRLVVTLHNGGYLQQDQETQRYSLGPKVMKLASLYAHRNPLPSAALKVFEKFGEKFDYNFYLGTLSHYEVVYLAKLDGRGPIKIVVEPGGTTALHSTALGKVLLASQSDAFIQGFIKKSKLTKYTLRSITSADVLWSQINEIRRQGFAVNDGEHYEDVGAVGVPIYNSDGSVSHGISLAYLRHLEAEGRVKVEDLVPLAREIASEIGLRAGPFINQNN